MKGISKYKIIQKIQVSKIYFNHKVITTNLTLQDKLLTTACLKTIVYFAN